MPNKKTCMDYGICDASGQNDIRESETKQRTKAKAMQQSVFPRPVRLVVIQEPFVEISQQCHESYAVLTLWKDADPDIPILKQAKAEYAKLQ